MSMATPRLIKDLAASLVERAHAARVIERIVKDCIAVTQGAESVRGILHDLGDRALPLEARQNVLKKALEKTVHPYVVNALFILQRNDMLESLTAFRSAVVREASRHAKHHEVRVNVATMLQDSERKSLEDVLRKKFGGTFHLEEQVDPGILGGILVEVGDWRVDASVKGKLERMKHALYV